MYTVYILQSEKLNRYYIGYTSDLEIRLDFYLNDIQARKFTHNADDWKLYLTINCSSKSQAMAIEKHIKAMKSKIYIENLQKHREIILFDRLFALFCKLRRLFLCQTQF